jgi:hypothetical protein
MNDYAYERAAEVLQILIADIVERRPMDKLILGLSEEGAPLPFIFDRNVLADAFLETLEEYATQYLQASIRHEDNEDGVTS